MLRFKKRCAVLLLFLWAGAAFGQSAYFPPGFTESVELDPTSGMSVQVASGGKPGAPLLVLVHGLGRQASGDWLPVLPALAREHRILIFDLPGFGRSDRPDAGLTPQRYADVLHGLIKMHSREPVFVAGHSLGAAVALLHSHAYPGQVRRLLLIDAAGILQTAVYARHLTRLPPRQGGPIVERLFNDTTRALNHLTGRLQDISAGRAESLAALVGSDSARGLLYRDKSNINAALGLVNHDFSPVLRGIRAPVWILWGEADRTAPLRTGHALHWLLPRSQLTVLPGVGHVPMAEAPALTADWILQSLKAPLPLTTDATASSASGSTGASQGDARCKGKRDQVYTGHWRSIRLERCANARIENAQIEQLVVNRGSVTLDQVRIESSATALSAKNATITATGLQIVAPRAMELDNSRLDLAALRVAAGSFGSDRNGSLVFFSLGYWCDGTAEWQLHDAVRPREGSLDPQLRKQAGGACAATNN